MSSSSSSNPWACTPADVALNPVNDLIKRYYEIKGLKSESSGSRRTTSDLIAKLRQADVLAAQKKELFYQMYLAESYPEVAKVAKLSEELNATYQKLCKYLEKFTATDALQESYFQTVRASQVIWDDLSQENKGRLIATIRQAVKAIETLNNNREFDEKTQDQVRVFEEVVLRTNVADESQNFDDFVLDDLHELLQECRNCLDLFRQHPRLKSAQKKSMEGADELEGGEK
ncbi:hypothetical protein EON64_08595 [archaeon]|nr:MAG: hypothetical protein EON64_08595 [archaeon]